MNSHNSAEFMILTYIHSEMANGDNFFFFFMKTDAEKQQIEQVTGI